MVNGMLGLILCNGIVYIVGSSLQINIFWMRMQRAWKWIVWQEWPHTLALLPIWYKEQWKEYYSHVKLATPFLLFCEFFSILPYIYISFFIAFFSPPSLLLCEIESQLPDLSKGQSCWLNPTPFPPFSLLLSLLWGPSNSRPSSAFLSHTAPSNRAALGLKQPPQHSTSQLEERSHCEKMQASSNPAPVMTGRRQLGALRGADWYMQHISPLSQSPQLSPPWKYPKYLKKPVMKCLACILCFIP